MINKTEPSNTSMPFRVKKANTFTSRLKGLMFRKQPLDQEGLWIVPCNSIHMFFMHFPIDAVFLDKQKQIVHLVPNLKPWKMITPVKGAYSVIELPIGTIEKFDLRMGSFISIEN